MKVYKLARGYGSKSLGDLTSIEAAIADTIRTDDYDTRGAVETVDRYVNNTAEMFGKLVNMLAENGHLTTQNVNELVGYLFDVREE